MSDDTIPLRDRILWNADRMVRRLSSQVVDEPAIRATLRRAVGKEVADPAVLPVHGFVTPYLPNPPERGEGHDRYRFPEAAVERAFYAVAALIAGQPRQARDQGTKDSEVPDEAAAHDETDQTEAGERTSSPTDTTSENDDPPPGPEPRPNLGATLGEAVTKGRLNADTTEARLHLLCRQSVEGAHKQLPRLIQYLRSREAPVDWGLLVLDLARWGGDRDAVAKEWVQGYHRVIQAEEQARRNESQDTSPDTDQNTHDDKDGA